MVIGSTLDFKNTYQYDALNRLVEIIQQGQSGGNAVTSKQVTQSYNGLRQLTSMARYQSTGTSNPIASTSFSFDTANRLTNIVHAQGSTTLASYAYTYDGLSRIASITSSIDGLSTYTYDVSSQLTDADHSSQTDETYDYGRPAPGSDSGFGIPETRSDFWLAANPIISLGQRRRSARTRDLRERVYVYANK